MMIDKKLNTEELLILFKNGQKEFHNIEVETGSLIVKNLEGIKFNECILAIDFTDSNLKNSVFMDSNIKTCIFKNSNLTNSKFINNSVCATDFKNAIIDNIIFEDNYYHSSKLLINDLK